MSARKSWVLFPRDVVAGISRNRENQRTLHKVNMVPGFEQVRRLANVTIVISLFFDTMWPSRKTGSISEARKTPYHADKSSGARNLCTISGPISTPAVEHLVRKQMKE